MAPTPYKDRQKKYSCRVKGCAYRATYPKEMVAHEKTTAAEKARLGSEYDLALCELCGRKFCTRGCRSKHKCVLPRDVDGDAKEEETASFGTPADSRVDTAGRDVDAKGVDAEPQQEDPPGTDDEHSSSATPTQAASLQPSPAPSNSQKSTGAKTIKAGPVVHTCPNLPCAYVTKTKGRMNNHIESVATLVREKGPLDHVHCEDCGASFCMAATRSIHICEATGEKYSATRGCVALRKKEKKAQSAVKAEVIELKDEEREEDDSQTASDGSPTRGTPGRQVLLSPFSSPMSTPSRPPRPPVDRQPRRARVEPAPEGGFWIYDSLEQEHPGYSSELLAQATFGTHPDIGGRYVTPDDVVPLQLITGKGEDIGLIWTDDPGRAGRSTDDELISGLRSRSVLTAVDNDISSLLEAIDAPGHWAFGSLESEATGSAELEAQATFMGILARYVTPEDVLALQLHDMGQGVELVWKPEAGPAARSTDQEIARGLQRRVEMTKTLEAARVERSRTYKGLLFDEEDAGVFD